MNERSDLITFKTCREAALEAWLLGTGRNCKHPSKIEGTWECKWQNRAIDECGFNHISFFCSSAAWACSVTDVLVLKNYDKINFANEKKVNLLFRHYVRFLLVISEVLDDLVSARMASKSISKKDARRALSKAGFISVDILSQFINRCCKHKFEGYHVCNFDLPIAFEDNPDFTPDIGDLSVTSINFESTSRIVMPKLVDIILVVISAYEELDLAYQDEYLFKAICEIFDFEKGITE